MATERVTERTDGVTGERITERTADPAPATTVVERRSGGMGGILLGLAALILVAVIAYFVINASQSRSDRDAAIGDAAGTVAESVQETGANVSEAARDAAGAVTPD